jgi:hypothetical protein
LIISSLVKSPLARPARIKCKVCNISFGFVNLVKCSKGLPTTLKYAKVFQILKLAAIFLSGLF